MSLIRALNAYVPRYPCRNCGLTWSQKPLEKCRDCKKNAVFDESHSHCEGCGYLFRTRTLDVLSLCGVCQNIYEPRAHKGICDLSLPVKSYLTKSARFCATQNRVELDCEKDPVSEDENSDSDEDYEIKKKKYTRSGYKKDGFVVSDSDDE